jgi:hypothetical protein
MMTKDDHIPGWADSSRDRTGLRCWSCDQVIDGKMPGHERLCSNPRCQTYRDPRARLLAAIFAEPPYSPDVQCAVAAGRRRARRKLWN